MKKILFFTYIITLGVFNTFAQNKIGINTDNPEQLFHVNADPSSPLNKTDDVVVTAEGNMGIGTTNPATGYKLDIVGATKVTDAQSTSLEVSGNVNTSQIGVGTDTPEALLHLKTTSDFFKFRLADGSQSSGHLLTCDVNGNAFWDGLKPASSVVYGSLASGILVANGERIPTNITSKKLSLSPGKWMIVAKAATAGDLRGSYMYIRLYGPSGFRNMPNDSEAGLSAVRLMQTGTHAETRNGSAYVATPSLSYIVSVPKKLGTQPGDSNYNSEFWIALISSGIEGKTTSDFGSLPFYAIRIDRED